jgi:hypothetical protein
VKLFSVGSVLEYFPAGLPIMAKTTNPQTYFTLFVSIFLGKEMEQ